MQIALALFFVALGVQIVGAVVASLLKSKYKIQIRQSKKWLAQAPAPKTALVLSVLRALCGST